MIPKIGPKKAPTVSTKDKIPIWLNIGIHRAPTKKAIMPIVTAEDIEENLLGAKLIKEY